MLTCSITVLTCPCTCKHVYTIIYIKRVSASTTAPRDVQPKKPDHRLCPAKLTFAPIMSAALQSPPLLRSDPQTCKVHLCSDHVRSHAKFTIAPIRSAALQSLPLLRSCPQPRKVHLCSDHVRSPAKFTFAPIRSVSRARPFSSSKEKRSASGLSMSRTPTILPSLRMGRTISDLDAASQAM